MPSSWDAAFAALRGLALRGPGLRGPGLRGPDGWRPWFVLPPQSSPLVLHQLARVRERYPATRVTYHTALSRQTIYQASEALFGEPLEVHLGLRGRARDDRVRQLLGQVGMGPYALRRYAYEFSGGQRQRIAIARSLTLSPDVLVLDEAVAALDVSVQAQVLNLLKDLQDELGLAYIFISHDLAVVRFMADDVMVMKDGRVVEHRRTDALLAHPQDDYTRRLIGAVARAPAAGTPA